MKKISTIALFSVIVAFVILVLGYYYFIKRKNITTTISIQSNATSNISQTACPDTSNWKSFSVPTYSFQFRYPPTWTAFDFGAGKQSGGINIFKSSEYSQVPFESPDTITVDGRTYYRSTIENEFEEFSKDISGYSNTGFVTIAGQKFLKTMVLQDPLGPFIRYSVNRLDGSGAFLIIAREPKDSSSQNEFLKTLQGILCSFKLVSL